MSKPKNKYTPGQSVRYGPAGSIMGSYSSRMTVLTVLAGVYHPKPFVVVLTRVSLSFVVR